MEKQVKEEYKDRGEYQGSIHMVDVPKKIVPAISCGTRLRIAKLYDAHEEFMYKIIKVAGWARSVRTGKDCCFVTLTDGSH
jgi:hypothetical protein